MNRDKNSDYTFSFQIGTPANIAQRAFDELPSLLTLYGMRNPLWIIPDDTLQKRVITSLVNSTFGKEYLKSITLLVHGTQEHLEEGEDSASGDKDLAYDSVVACGNTEIARAGQAIASKKDIRILLVPFGRSDANEYRWDLSHRLPCHAVIDGRLTRLATPVGTARSMCFTLLQVCTALLETTNPMMISMANSAFFHAHQALEHMVDASGKRSSWTACTLSSKTAEHAAGICAQNRENHAILDFSERLAIPGLADRYQSAGALLPYVCIRLQKEHPDVYEMIQSSIMGMDPVEFTRVWLSLSDPKGTDRIITYLCGDMHDLLTHPRNVRELLPLLSLFPGQGGSE